ncbi:MAG: type II toxin-antitoxin system HipA family toxin [Gammaproteobacteria bacterium]|nr:type II toxin-antitoxin system HipA family toxin [Gammaproteobacteria bacterium]
MKQRIRVVIGQMCLHVGDLVFEHDGLRQSSAFRYSEEWLENEYGFALSPRYELNSSWVYNTGIDREVFPGFIADGAPDSWGRTVLTHAHGNQLDELVTLLSVNDQIRSGALRYIDETGDIVTRFNSPTPQLADLAVLRASCVALGTHKNNLNGIALKLRGTCDSLGGFRPKSSYQNDEDLAIAKFSLASDRLPMERMEVAILNLARETNLRASQASLVLFDTHHPVAIVKRFDRIGSRRVHYVSADTFMEPQSRGSDVCYTDIADMMRSTCGNGEETLKELRELFRRILFNILITNTDDHLQNFGFLYVQQGRWQLAPMFDINPDIDRQRFAKTGIADPNEKYLSLETAIESSEYFEISRDVARVEATKMAKVIRDNWQKHCLNAGMTRAQCHSYRNAFNHSEIDTALKFGFS